MGGGVGTQRSFKWRDGTVSHRHGRYYPLSPPPFIVLPIRQLAELMLTPLPLDLRLVSRSEAKRNVRWVDSAPDTGGGIGVDAAAVVAGVSTSGLVETEDSVGQVHARGSASGRSDRRQGKSSSSPKTGSDTVWTEDMEVSLVFWMIAFRAALILDTETTVAMVLVGDSPPR